MEQRKRRMEFGGDVHSTTGNTEEETVKGFRQLRVEDFESMYSRVFSDFLLFQKFVLNPKRYRDKQRFSFRTYVYPLINDHPEVFTFCCMLEQTFPKFFFNKHSKAFGLILDTKKHDSEISQDIFGTMTRTSIQTLLTSSIALLCTPDTLDEIIAEGKTDGSLLNRRVLESLRRLVFADNSIESVLDGVISLLQFDHPQTMRYLSHLSDEQLADLKMYTPNEHRKFCTDAGNHLATHTFQGILTDMEHQGKDNLFRFHQSDSVHSKRTDRGKCPADTFVLKYLTGLGLALQRRRSSILRTVHFLHEWRPNSV
jgi:hypothetical protein